MVDYGKRMIVNGQHCSVLIKNMPLGDVNKYEALINFSSLICDVMDSRIGLTKMEAVTNQQTRQLQHVFQFVLDYLRAIRDGSDELHREAVHINENMCDNLALSIGEIVRINDLSDEIEKRILDIGNACLKETDSFLGDGLKFSDQVGEFITLFDKILTQEHLLDEDYTRMMESLDKVDIYKFKRDCKRRRNSLS